MTLIDLLETLRARNINIWADGERLRYRGPLGALTPDIREELTKYKPELLTFLNETNRMQVTRAPITKIPPGAKLVLSINQRRLWFIDQLQPNTAFNSYKAFRIKGPLNIASLEESLNEIVRRHETLRTSFSAIDGEPLQVVTPALKLRLTLIHLGDIVDGTERETEAERIMTEEVERPFDLAKGPLFRVHVLCLGADDYLLLITIHHIVTDGWSTGILLNELTVLYEAFCNGNPSPLPELPIQYVDFAHWQAQCLEGEVLQQELSLWKERLKDAPQLAELLTDYARPPVQSFAGASETVIVSKSRTNSLKTLSKNHGVTLFMTVLAAFKTLLYRYSGQEDLVVGSPIAGRARLELENLIGLFINTLVLRSDLSGNPTFRELLKRTREVALEAYAHQEVPFEKLIEALRLDRSLSFSPLFQIMFVLQNPPTELKLVGSAVRRITIKRETALSDLFLSFAESDEGLHGTLSYRTDLFDRSTISDMMRRFQILLEGIVADPDRPISTLPLLLETEKHQLLFEWNDTNKPRPHAKYIHQLFQEQVERSPDAIAVSCGAQKLTYEELNHRANRLGQYLKKQGVGPEVIVGIYMERSLDLLVGLLGVLKAGGTYLPLDPSYPTERLAFMLEDSHPVALLTHRRLANSLIENSKLKSRLTRAEGPGEVDSQASTLNPRISIVCLDTHWETISVESEKDVSVPLASENSAYVIYTSGSTGKSKGVIVTHNSLVNAYLAWEEAYQLRSARTVHLQMASFSFDVFSGDWVRALCSGGKLVLCPTEFLLEPAQLYALAQREQVDCAEFVPAVMRNLLQYLEESGQRLEFMRILVVAADVWLVEEYQNIQRFCGTNTRLINSYGLTEATIDSSYFGEGVEGLRSDRVVPIGKPFDNTQLYVLDCQLQPVPVRVPGEVYVAGDSLARGYLNRPDLTADRFIPHPFSDKPGRRLYRTGDLARYLPDGNIEFLRRIDDQVKIRGFRIELGEIETVLSQHPTVRETVVLARQAVDNSIAETCGDRQQDTQSASLRAGKRLVAYVVPKGESTIDELRGFVREKLPEYMVPSAFVFLDSLPLTPNGKVDRRALPAPDQSRQELEERFVAPRTPVEEIIGEIWAEVLKLDQVGVQDNFFELGGHSLLATQVMSRVRKVLQVELPLRSLFEAPTVAALTERIEALRREVQGQVHPAIVAMSREGELPLSFAQERLWFLDQLEPGSSLFNISMQFRVSGGLDVSALERSINEIARRHEALRTTFKSVDGTPRQVIARQLVLPLPVIDLSDCSSPAREEEARRYVAEFARRPFDLSQGPLVRAALVRLGEQEHIFLLSMHHIVSDGWSMGIFFRELSAIYEAYTQDQKSPLPELPIQYTDYAVWQREWLQGDVLESQLSYWRKQLANISSLNLVTDRPRPVIQTFHGGRQSVVLSKELTQALKGISRKQGVSLFMTLLAALQILLHRLTGQDDIAVGSPIAGRTRAEVEKLIGFFLNSLVLRTDLSGDPTFSQLLEQVRGTCLDAYAHQDVPFEKLLEELRPERDLSRTPFFQVFLNMVNVAPRRKPSGLKLEPLSHGAEAQSKFDLTIYARERDGSLHLNWVYNSDLFDRERIQEMISQYETLLTAISREPSASIHAYSLLTPSAKERLPAPLEPLASDWMGAVHDKFAQHAQSFPDRIAITDPSGSWNYAELNARSNELANYLLENGIQREEIIAIYPHRSAALAWALLGILKAGAAFLLLDPAYPPARLIQYVRGAKPRGFISLEAAGAVPADLEQVLQETIRCRIALPRLPQTEAENLLKNYSTQNPEVEIYPDDLAYISYTSGSTGEPKGVMGRHGPLSHFLPWQAAHFDLTSADQFSLLSGLSHDPLHREILTALWVGGTLCIPDPDVIGASGDLAEWMARQHITFAHLTPALGRLLADGAKPECKIPSLRYAFFIGDKLTRRDLSCLRRLAPQVTNVNYYGSTETQRAVSYQELSPQAEDGPGGSVLPVGRGMPGAQLLVLTKAQDLAGIGEVGEIYMRSPHLARGYLGDPALTEARFMSNPFTGQLNDRLYRTGDLGRYLNDGTVEVLGRMDGQINIRGFRIETGEIEFSLSQCPKVRDAVVVARHDEDGDKRLIAYIVAADDSAPSSQELRSFLKQQLPDHMIPSAFVSLESLPLTPNGKVDRNTLPVPDQSRPGLRECFVAPRTPVEEIIGEIWAEVLKVDKVGVNDNFFDLGGHSLLATQVISRARYQLQVDLPLRVLFEHPTVAELAQRIEALSREAERPGHQPIAVVSRKGELPLSFAQERLWFLDQLEAGSSVYNMSGAYRVLGGVDIAALEQSLNEILRRHEVLRTTFKSVDGVPRQMIAAQLNISLPVIDLSDHSSIAREDEARRYSAEFARRPFDLSRGLLIRAGLVRLGEEEHIFLLSMHHIISDGWSMGIFFRELLLLYEAYTNQQSSPLPELPIQYADYAIWQRNWLQGDILESQLSYWRKQLANTSPLNLVTDRPRPAVQTFHGGRQSAVLSKELTQALKGISRKQGTSLFMTLLAALQILLHRLTGQDDIVVGSPIAGRNRAEIEGLIGFFLNSLVLRTDVSGDPTFSELLGRARKVCLDAYAHQDVPFEKLLEELRPERDLSRTPFFQVFLNMLNVGARNQAGSLKLEPVSHGAEVESKFDLTIYARERDGALHLNCVYNADLFDRERIQEMLSQYETLLTAISREPSASIHAYSLLTPSAKERLPDPLEPLASDWMGSVHDKFAEHAGAFPDRIAITDPSGSWSYAELNARSNELAHYLLKNGIEREEIIAIYAHRSAALAWALLAVLKAGAAFLMLDPAYPPARLIQYVRVAKPRGFISLEAAGAVPADLEQVLQETIRCRITLPKLPQTRAESPVENYSSEDPKIEIHPNDLAYISYTSGSTGEPKGVMGRHAPLSHFLPWQAAHFDLTPVDRFSLLSGLSHDPLHREILTALWVGATLCIPDPDVIGVSGELAEWMAWQKITFAHLTPALGRLLADAAKPDCKIASLRYAFFIGEKLTRRDLSCLRRLAPQVININYYGSTETQRAVSYQELSLQAEEGPGGSVVPVGRGMPGAQLLLLTRAQKLTGSGEVGEIYMRSPHLARGYLGDPSLTQARFIVNPFTGQPDDRLYRTGDLGRYLRDGTVEVLGRMDGQVNIRGFRIETGEIEFALSQCPGMRDAVVVARENADGDNKLIGYVVAAQGPAPSFQDLRSFLKQRLPDHMIPSAFVHLKSLPLTPNAKVDRSALPAPDDMRQDQDTVPIAPRDRLELQLREIWQKVLRRPLGVRDNFFDLGGHSLLAVRLFAQIEKVTGLRLPVAALFHAPTIEQLAKLMSEQGWSAQWKSLVAIQPGGSRPPLFCVHAHDGGVLFWRDLARYLGADQPFYALQPQGLDGRQPLHTTIEEMAAHYVQEIRILQAEGPYYIGGHCIGGLIAFEMAQQLHSQGEKVAFLALVDSFAPIGKRRKRTSRLRRYRYRAIRLFERTIGIHLGNLSVLKSSERLAYVKGKIDRALYKLYMTLGSRWVPAARNRQNILKAGSRASRQYKPQVYPGKITLFRATDLGGGIEHDPQMGWVRWAGGELETHLIPGYHAHIVLEPRVRLLAKELSRSLSQAQETHQAVNDNERSARLADATETIVHPYGKFAVG